MILSYALQDDWVRFVIDRFGNRFEKIIHCDQYESTQTFLMELHEWVNKNTLSCEEEIIIATHQGPGRFTRIRTLLSLAQGLYLGFSVTHRNLKLITPTRWEIMNFFLKKKLGEEGARPCYLALECKKDTYYTCFAHDNTLKELETLSTEQFIKIMDNCSCFVEKEELLSPAYHNNILASFEEFASCEHMMIYEYVKENFLHTVNANG